MPAQASMCSHCNGAHGMENGAVEAATGLERARFLRADE
jgi:hypothetical protein